jgi:RNA binding exosome subunit
MFEDIILLVCTHLAFFWMGYKWGIHNAVIRIITNYLANPEDMQQAFNRLNDLKDDEESDAEIAVEARVEGQQVYLWRKDTQTFLAQGKTIDEAILAISQNHQGTYKIDKETVDRIRAELPNRL